MATAKRQALFVLGMHRSGTSAFSGVLANLGAQAPKTLMVPTKDNPQGYWESLELLKAHDRILSSAGSRWNDWGPFNPAWIETAAAEEFMALLPQLIKGEFGNASLLLIKDPRVCRFFPLWQIALRKLRITPKVVIPVRHPLEVARSLEVRDQFGRNRSLLLWLRHVLDAEASTRDVARTFVRYDQLLDDWQAEARKISRDLDIQWPKWSGDTETRIADFLSSELRHHSDADKPVPGGGELAGWVNHTYQVLQQLAKDGEPAKSSLESLDRIRHEFDRTSAMYAAVVREHEIRVEALYSDKKAELADKSQLLEDRNRKYEDLAKSYATAEQSIAKHQAKVESVSAQLAEKTRQLGERNRKYEELARGHAVGQQALSEQKARIATLAEELEARRQDHAQLISAHRQEIESLASTQRQVLASFAARDAERNELAANLAKAAANVELHARDIADLREAAAKAAASLEERFKEIAKLTSLVFELEQKLANAEATRDELIDRHRQQLAARDQALAAHIASSHAAEKQQQRRFALLEHALAGSRNENAKQVQWIDFHRRHAARIQAELDAIRASATWKITKPFRLRQPAAQNDDASGPPGDETEQQIALLQASELFDPDWYLDRHPEVAESGLPPAQHYLRSGSACGYDPSAAFDTVEYLVRYPDVRLSGMNPLVHFIEYGSREGRVATARGAGEA